jgi:hypothetical protein
MTHALINPHTYATTLIQLTRVDPPMIRPTHPLVRGGFCNHVHKELQHSAIIYGTWGGRIFNKRELVQVYVLAGHREITTMDLVMTVPHGYMHAKEPQVHLSPRSH